MELIILCHPQKTYLGKLEKEVSREYTEMAIEDYDKLVSFDDKYIPFSETPDYEAIAGNKKGRNLFLTLFFNQPIIRVGNINNRFQSSSYLFNPETPDQTLLPDLDVVQIEGIAQIKDVAKTIQRFYEKYGWKTYIYDGKIEEKKEIKPTSKRIKHPIEIINPDFLRELAKEKTGYSTTDFYF